MALPKRRSLIRECLLAPWPYHVIAAISAACSAVANTVGATAYAYAIGGSIVTVISVVTSILVTVHQKKNEDDISPLEGSLQTLYTILVGEDVEETHGLRICLHVPVGDDQLEQYTDYVGGQDKVDGKAGRQFPIQSGIIGRAARLREPQVARRESDDSAAFIRELMDEWHYTEQGARSLRQDSYSWAAYPIPPEKGVTLEAILFCDSKRKDFFSEERQKMLLWACVGIAAFIGRRYK